MDVDRAEDPRQPDSEGSGDDLRPGQAAVDSSEEESDNSEAERQVREGFIVDEDEGGERRRKRKRKRKHKKRPSEEVADDLDDDDLDLIGKGPSGQSKYKRVRRFASPGSDDLDREDANLAIFDDDEMAPAGAGYDDEMDDFIELDPEEQAIQDAHKAAGRKTGKSTGGSTLKTALRGITKESWEEVAAIFGTGDEYAWAMELDEEDTAKPDPHLKDVFEPAIIKERMMTDEDEKVRHYDVPERMQMLAVRTLGSQTAYCRTQLLLSSHDLDAAALWIAPKIDPKLTEEYLLLDMQGNPRSRLYEPFMAAIKRTLDEMHVKSREVPFIWMHRRDYLMAVDANGSNKNLMERPHLWRIQALSYEYRSFVDRRMAVERLWHRLGMPEDPYFADYHPRLQTVEEVADLSDWINTRFCKELRQVRQAEEDYASTQGLEEGAAQRVKRASRLTSYERAKDSYVAALAAEMAIEPRTLIQAFITSASPEYKEDPPAAPHEYAQQFIQDGSPFSSVDIVLAAAKTILVQEIKTDPYLKREIRRRMLDGDGVLNIKPTEKGRATIDEHHPFYAFKYISGKPLGEISGQPQFLAMLAAEKEDLTTIEITLTVEAKRNLRDQLQRIYLSDFTSQAAQAWNGLRQDVLDAAINEHIVPSIARYAKAQLAKEAEESVLRKCRQDLETEIEAAPYKSVRMETGETPSVVAVSHGAGDPRRDHVVAVFLDASGRFRDQIKLDGLVELNNFNAMREPERKAARDADRNTFVEFLKHRKPDVVVVNGFTYSTKSLFCAVQALTSQFAYHLATERDMHDKAKTETIYVNDATARIYQHSKRAIEELPQLTTVARYCVGLARYTQSPLNEYAALGDQITSITFDPHQKYTDEDRLRAAMQQALVNIVNYVGVDVNRTLRDSYYASLLPFIGGLGPRKAQGLMKAIRSIGDTLVSRSELLAKNLVRENIFMSCSAFLKIDQAFVESSARDPEDGPDVLDSTRIHSEDYDIARKMASDAEELDEEDIAALTHPSEAVKQLMDGDAHKLNDLRLDDFAVELQRLMGIPKRITLYLIREELQRPFNETRTAFRPLSDAEAFRAISGETPETFSEGLIVPVVVVAPPGKNDFMRVRLESGLEGLIDGGHMLDADQSQTIFTAGQALRALIIDAKPAQLMREKDPGNSEDDWKRYLVNLDCRPKSLEHGDAYAKRTALALRDKHYDTLQETTDAASLEAAKKKAAGRQRRLIQHPNFHNFNAGQAEHYLATQMRGDCVIRPSSLGTDYLACTWKVADGVYAHLQVTELNKPDGNPLALGGLLQIGGKFKYADLDELIYLHVRAMATKVEEMMAHEKFKGTEEELLTFLRNFQMANPDKPAYGFSIDKKHPGQFNLTFITSKGTQPKTWPVKVAPGAFQLFEAEQLPDIRSLCNAFKLQYNQLMMQNAGGVSSARTPYGQGGRTPGRHTPGGARTPSAYSGAYR